MNQDNENTGQSLTIEELWVRYHEYRENGDGCYYRNKLTEHYYKTFIERVARRIHLPRNIELEDSIQEGVFGLIDAIEKFDPSIGVKFETYGYPRIKGSILDALKKEDWIPRFVRLRSKQVKKAESRLNHNFSREELIDELSKDDYAADPVCKKESVNLKGGRKALKIIEETESVRKIRSFSEIFYGEISENDSLEDYNTNPVNHLQKKDLAASLIKGLTKPELLIIELYYYKDKTMEEIAEIVGSTMKAVSIRHCRALKWLRYKARIKKIGLEDIE